MEPITLLIADDHTLIRETWSLILKADPRFNVIAETGNGEDAIELARELKPNVILMDINLPGIDGMEATQQIRKFSPGSKVLAISFHTQPGYATQMMKKGAMGYVTKNSSSAEMFKAILEVYDGKKYICDEIKNNLSEKLINGTEQTNGVNALTQREMEIITFVKKGNSSKDIAKALQIAVKTVEVHRHNILKKLNLKNSPALVNFFNNNQLGI
jgi:two-component system invasion response regulator UvrY